jgi:HNH endonuclease
MAHPSRTDLTAEQVRGLFDYDVVSGQLRWKVANSRRIRVGDIAGCDDGGGYLRIGISGRHYRAHRIIWLMMTGAFPEHQIDHIDGDRANNHWANLREATNAQNHQNLGLNRNSTTGHPGVSLIKGAGRKTPRWEAHLKVNGRKLI